MTFELDFFDTQLSTDTLGADTEGALGAKKEGERRSATFVFFILLAGEQYINH